MKALLSAIALSSLAFAAYADSERGGFKGPDNYKFVTVAQALQLPDDTDVRVEGYLVRSLGDEKYELQDDTGVMIVEIDDDDWDGVEATPDTRVRIHGEIDKDRGETELEADNIQVAE